MRHVTGREWLVAFPLDTAPGTGRLSFNITIRELGTRCACAARRAVTWEREEGRRGGVVASVRGIPPWVTQNLAQGSDEQRHKHPHVLRKKKKRS